MKWFKKQIKLLISELANNLPPQILNQLPVGIPNKKEQWSIGIYGGISPFVFADLPVIQNPVISRRNITDVRAGFVADPFMIQVDSTWYMFFEVFNQGTQLGEIGLATSPDALHWTYKQIVLAEPFHLSYPYVFVWEKEIYMVPESYQANSVRLYRAAQFPLAWQFVGNLLSGATFLDSSLFQYGGNWWLMTETNPDHRFDTLRLYHAETLLGPWTEHPQSPIVSGNVHIARPGGRVVVWDDKPIRYTQDCWPDYGTKLRAFEISLLTTTDYCEREVTSEPVLSPSGQGWNGSGMHHLDPHPQPDGRWIACVDGRVKC